MYLFLAVLGLHCCVQAFSSCGEQGLHFIAVCRLLIAVSSLAVEHRLWGTQASIAAALRLSSFGTQVFCFLACGIFPNWGLNSYPFH